MVRGIVFCLLALAAPAWARVVLIDGHVRLPPPGSPNTAAFMVLRNEGERPVVLTAVSSPGAVRAELHTHLYEGGMMKMRRVEALPIPAKGELAFEPGGTHIMLFGVAGLSEDASFPLILTLDDGQILLLHLPLRPVAPVPAHSSRH